MNSKELNDNYNKTKNIFHNYIDNIKKNIPIDIYSVINTTLVKNPFDSNFPKNFFYQIIIEQNIILIFIISSLKFYIKMTYSFISYLIAYFIYKIYSKKIKLDLKNYKVIDIFFLVDKITKENKFNENYFVNLYEVFQKHNQKYIFLPRLYGGRKNPFKLIKFFKILKKDNNKFLFEYQLLTAKDFISILIIIFKYPFKTLRLLQKENLANDKLFNKELLKDISNSSFDTFSRYVFGKNISVISDIQDIYSWSEFQVIERSFNYAIRINNNNIKLHACQFYLSYETYFNTFIDDIDFEHKTSPHEVLVNGQYYILKRDKIKYKKGVSLRYNSIFKYNNKIELNNIFLIGSYVKNDTKYMLECVSSFKNVIFKSHPTVINKLSYLQDNVTSTDMSIYDIFKICNIVIGTASGTLVEAISCGLSVIVISSKDNLTANPLVDYGKGKIWDIAFSKNDVKLVYNNLLKYRKENLDEIKKMSLWYKNNFFVEPTEENIIEAFDLNKGTV